MDKQIYELSREAHREDCSRESYIQYYQALEAKIAWMQQEAYAASATIERLREALYECARNLEEQVSASYWHVEQPFDANMQRRYDRDMARAHKAFAALGGKE